jgi:hypothetical protein
MENLLNIDETIPDEFYVFINFQNIQAKYNLETNNYIFSSAFAYSVINKEFIEKYVNGTAQYLPFIQNEEKDLSIVSPFASNITSDYRTEYNAELYRYKNFPLYPSRLSALYAFGNYDTCLEVSKKYGWDINTVRKFKLKLSPVNRVIKVNMEIVSLDRMANRGSSSDFDTIDLVWKHYWTGEGEMKRELPVINGRQIRNSGIIWEYLIEGVLELTE